MLNQNDSPALTPAQRQAFRDEFRRAEVESNRRLAERIASGTDVMRDRFDGVLEYARQLGAANLDVSGPRVVQIVDEVVRLRAQISSVREACKELRADGWNVPAGVIEHRLDADQHTLCGNVMRWAGFVNECVEPAGHPVSEETPHRSRSDVRWWRAPEATAPKMCREHQVPGADGAPIATPRFGCRACAMWALG